MRIARRALAATGHEPVVIDSGGGSDANALRAKGMKVVNLANGTERPHMPDERVSAQALNEMLDVSLGLLEAAGEELE